MRILSIQYGNIKNPYSHGGLANSLHEAFKRLASHHHITCFTGLIPGKSRHHEIDGVHYSQVGWGSNKFLNRISFSTINSIFKSFRDFDLVLVPWDRYAPVVNPSTWNCPLVLELGLEFFSIPSKIKPFEPIIRFLVKKQLQHARYLLAMSEGVMEAAHQYAANVRLKEILPGGVPLELINYPAETGKEDYLLYLGRLDVSHKGIDILLESYIKSGVDIPLVIAGDGVDQNKVKKLILHHHLEEKVKTVGWVKGEAKYRLLNDCMAVCIPSRVEGWGIVATEAAARGKPVIGTRVVGLEESVTDGKTGILVQKDNIDAFGKALQMIVQDKEFRKILGEHAREMAQQHTWDRIAKRREAFFYKVVDDFRRLQPARLAPVHGINVDLKKH